MNNEQLNSISKEFANQLLNIVGALSDKMISRKEDSAKPRGLSRDHCAGFVTKDEKEGELSMYADLFAKTDQTEALLRISGITIAKSATGEDLFSSLTLQFNVDEIVAHQTTSSIVEAGVADLRSVLNHEKTTLKSLRHSNTKDTSVGSSKDQIYDIVIGANNEVVITTKDDQPIDVSVEELTTSVSEVLNIFQALASSKSA